MGGVQSLRADFSNILEPLERLILVNRRNAIVSQPDYTVLE